MVRAGGGGWCWGAGLGSALSHRSAPQSLLSPRGPGREIPGAEGAERPEKPASAGLRLPRPRAKGWARGPARGPGSPPASPRAVRPQLPAPIPAASAPLPLSRASARRGGAEPAGSHTGRPSSSGGARGGACTGGLSCAWSRIPGGHPGLTRVMERLGRGPLPRPAHSVPTGLDRPSALRWVGEGLLPARSYPQGPLPAAPRCWLQAES